MGRKVEITKEIGERLKQLREGLGISQIDMAQEAGVSNATISRIEGGANTTIPVIRAICAMLNKPVPEALGFDPDLARRPMRAVIPGLARRLEAMSHESQERLLRALEDGLLVPNAA